MTRKLRQEDQDAIEVKWIRCYQKQMVNESWEETCNREGHDAADTAVAAAREKPCH